MDKGSTRLEKVSKLRKKKSRQWMGENQVKRSQYREWRIKNEVRIWKRKKRNYLAISPFGIKKIKNRKDRIRNRARSKRQDWKQQGKHR